MRSLRAAVVPPVGPLATLTRVRRAAASAAHQTARDAAHLLPEKVRAALGSLRAAHVILVRLVRTAPTAGIATEGAARRLIRWAADRCPSRHKGAGEACIAADRVATA